MSELRPGDRIKIAITEDFYRDNKVGDILYFNVKDSFPCKIIELTEKEAVLEEFADSELKEFGNLICKQNSTDKNHCVADLLNKTENDRWKEIIAELSFKEDLTGNPEKTLEDCIRVLRLKKSNRERKKIKSLIEQAEANHNDSLSLKYQKQYQGLLTKEREIQQYKLNFHQI